LLGISRDARHGSDGDGLESCDDDVAHAGLVALQGDQATSPSSISFSARNVASHRMGTQNKIRVLAVKLRRFLTSVHTGSTGSTEIDQLKRISLMRPIIATPAGVGLALLLVSVGRALARG
jgi:hypothetical protein